MSEKGTVSINAQNIMPIIKKWLYSDKDIFIRELVSNAVDACVKHSRLVEFGKVSSDGEEYSIKVTFDSENKTVSFSDNGIGMTYEEVEKYINQVAFSGAQEFLKKYESENKETGIIGHFGLGFYSAFMAAKTVTIESLSWQDGATPVKWVSKDGIEFEMSQGEKSERGTVVTLELDDDSIEFCSSYTLKTILEKYCSFISTPLYLGDERINDTPPLWLKKPSECTAEEYKEFYSKVFNDYNEPLFWVHLNADYPFNLKGILYFPKYRDGFGSSEGQVKMYCGQVFVADNVKEVIPEFLLLLKGSIDCPDIPLNVSRSFLQNDDYVRKLSAYITRKVADKLISLFETDRERYESYWSDIHPFVKYGCMKEAKFFEKVKKALLFKSSDGSMIDFESLEKLAEENEKTVYYANDEIRQASAIKLFSERYNVLIFDSAIDLNFLSFLEYSNGSEIKFQRIDSSTDAIKSDGEISVDTEKLTELFRKALGDENLSVKAENLNDTSVHALILYDEQMRRFKEMSRFYGEQMELPQEKTVVINAKSPLIKRILECENEDNALLICAQVADLAELMISPLSDARMADFIKRSSEILEIINL